MFQGGYPAAASRFDDPYLSRYAKPPAQRSSYYRPPQGYANPQGAYGAGVAAFEPSLNYRNPYNNAAFRQTSRSANYYTNPRSRRAVSTQGRLYDPYAPTVGAGYPPGQRYNTGSVDDSFMLNSSAVYYHQDAAGNPTSARSLTLPGNSSLLSDYANYLNTSYDFGPSAAHVPPYDPVARGHHQASHLATMAPNAPGYTSGAYADPYLRGDPYRSAYSKPYNYANYGAVPAMPTSQKHAYYTSDPGGLAHGSMDPYYRVARTSDPYAAGSSYYPSQRTAAYPANPQYQGATLAGGPNMAQDYRYRYSGTQQRGYVDPYAATGSYMPSSQYGHSQYPY